MIAALLISVASTGAVYAAGQDCGHGYAACNYGYGFTQRGCMSCQYGPSCSPTRPFNYRLAIDYPWTVPSYARAKALTQGVSPAQYAQPMRNQRGMKCGSSTSPRHPRQETIIARWSAVDAARDHQATLRSELCDAKNVACLNRSSRNLQRGFRGYVVFIQRHRRVKIVA